MKRFVLISVLFLSIYSANSQNLIKFSKCLFTTNVLESEKRECEASFFIHKDRFELLIGKSENVFKILALDELDEFYMIYITQETSEKIHIVHLDKEYEYGIIYRSWDDKNIKGEAPVIMQTYFQK